MKTNPINNSAKSALILRKAHYRTERAFQGS